MWYSFANITLDIHTDSSESKLLQNYLISVSAKIYVGKAQLMKINHLKVLHIQTMSERVKKNRTSLFSQILFFNNKQMLQ